MESSTYYRILKMSEEERYRAYMEKSKEDLARTLARRDAEEPVIPKYAISPYELRPMICRNWNDCTNPNKDCPGCPLKTDSGDRSFVVDVLYTSPDTPHKDIWY